MFRATVCTSSGEITVSIRHLEYVTLYGWLSGMQEHMLLHTSHPYRITITKCHTNTVVSPDDVQTVARNM